MGVVFYMTSVSSSLAIKKQQQKIELVLEGQGIPYEAVDISVIKDAKDKMRQLSGNDKALPPQLFNGDHYCGDYDAFEHALEMEQLQSFLKLEGGEEGGQAGADAGASAEPAAEAPAEEE
eukprot:m.99316 g.99316  ORF g.99316 m.99316 type:complete len:120 (-) comp18605_c0_seq2:28-387(-)